MAPSRCAAETTPGPHPLCSLFTAGRIEAARQHHHHPPTRHRNEGLQNLPPSIHDQYTLKQLENSMDTLVTHILYVCIVIILYFVHLVGRERWGSTGQKLL